MTKTELGFTVEDKPDFGSCAKCHGPVPYTHHICCNQCWINATGFSRIAGLHHETKEKTRKAVNELDEFNKLVAKQIADYRLNMPECVHQELDDVRLECDHVKVAAMAFIQYQDGVK